MVQCTRSLDADLHPASGCKATTEYPHPKLLRLDLGHKMGVTRVYFYKWDHHCWWRGGLDSNPKILKSCVIR